MNLWPKSPPWAKTVASVGAVLATIVGAAGAPDDLKQWYTWFEAGVPWWIFFVFALVLLALAWGSTVWNWIVRRREGVPTESGISPCSDTKLAATVAILRYETGDHLEDSPPYLDFHFAIFNGSGHPVSIGRTISGRVRYRERPLQNECFVAEAILDLPYTANKWLHVHQHLTAEEASRITADRDEEYSQRHFGFANVAISIDSTDPNRNDRSDTLRIGDPPRLNPR